MTKKTGKRSAAQRRPAPRRHSGVKPDMTISSASGDSSENPMLAEMRRQSRGHLNWIWIKERLGLPISGEDALTAHILREHEEWYDVWDSFGEDPDQDIEIDGVNPVMHVMFHGTAENQLAADNPKDVKLVLEALMRQGLDRHEAIHRIAGVMSEEVYFVMSDKRAFDESAYVQRLWELVESDASVM